MDCAAGNEWLNSDAVKLLLQTSARNYTAVIIDTISTIFMLIAVLRPKSGLFSFSISKAESVIDLFPAFRRTRLAEC